MFVDNLQIVSLRGKRGFRLPWQSRRSANANKGAFQQIPTAPNVHVYLAVVSIDAIGNSVPRDDTQFEVCNNPLLSSSTTYCHFTTKFFDHEGWRSGRWVVSLFSLNGQRTAKNILQAYLQTDMHLRNKLSIATGIHSHQYYRATDSAIATNNMGRVVSSQRHLTEGAAGKTTLHQLDTRREASIRRSR